MASSIAGEVVVGPGTYNVSGAVLARDTTLRLAPGATLVGNMTNHVVMNRTDNYIATVTAGSTTASVTTTTADMRVGDAVMIRDAGEEFDGFIDPHNTTIAAILSPTTIQLATPPHRTATLTTMTVGASNVHVTGGTVDGNKGPTDGNNWFPVYFATGANCHVTGSTLINGDHGGVMFAHGCNGGSVRSNTIRDFGFPASNLGSGVWLFRGVSDVLVENNTIFNGYGGVAVDDRTGVPSWEDAVSFDNIVRNNTISVTGFGVIAEGVSTNTIADNSVTGARWGVYVLNSTQFATTPRPSIGNVVTGNTLINCTTGIELDGVGSVQSGNTFVNCTTNIVNTE